MGRSGLLSHLLRLTRQVALLTTLSRLLSHVLRLARGIAWLHTWSRVSTRKTLLLLLLAAEARALHKWLSGLLLKRLLPGEGVAWAWVRWSCSAALLTRKGSLSWTTLLTWKRSLRHSLRPAWSVEGTARPLVDLRKSGGCRLGRCCAGHIWSCSRGASCTSGCLNFGRETHRPLVCSDASCYLVLATGNDRKQVRDSSITSCRSCGSDSQQRNVRDEDTAVVEAATSKYMGYVYPRGPHDESSRASFLFFSLV